MRILINSLYVEPGLTFEVSSNVMDLISSKIEFLLNPSNIFNQKFKGFDIGFTISTKREIDHLKITEPLIDREEKEVYFTIWMPHDKIHTSENYMESYLDYLFKGILLGLNKYAFETEVLENTFNEIKKEVLNNPNTYTFKRESTSIDQMLDDIEIFEE
jgi:hypothetical protein